MLKVFRQLAALLGIAWILAGCRPPLTVDLASRTPQAIALDREGRSSTPPPAQDYRRHLEQDNEWAGKPEPKAWVRYDLPRDATYVYARSCENVLRIYQDDQLVMASDSNKTYPSVVRLFAHGPFVALPKAGGSLYFQTFYSSKTQFEIACGSLHVGTRDRVLWQFLTGHSPTLISGIVVVFLGLAGLILTFFDFSRALFYFSTFALSMGMVFLSGAEIPEQVLGAGNHWTNFWHLSYTFVPIPFFLFFDAVLQPPYRFARKLALLNLTVFVLYVLAFFSLANLDMELIRIYVSRIYLVEGLIFIAIIIQAIVLRLPYSRLYGGAILLFLFAAMFDIYSGLMRQSFTPLAPWFFLIFVTFCLVSLVIKKLRDDSETEREKATWVQERNRRLQGEVEKRIEALGKRSVELEATHVELEERLDLLMGQKRKVAELAQEQDNLLTKIADIHQVLLPRLVKKLQSLHEAIDPYQIPKVGDTINEIGRILEPLAQLYRTRSVTKQRRIIALCSNKKHQRSLRAALGGSKIDFRIADNAEEFATLLTDNQPDMIVLDESSSARIRDYHEKNPKATIILLIDGSAEDGLRYLCENTMLDQAFSLQLPKGILHKMLMTHFSKFINRDLFGIEKYLMWGSVVKERPILSRETTEPMLAAVKRDLEFLDLSTTAHPKVLNICQLLLKVSESELITKRVDDEKSIRQLRFGYDANLVAISLDLTGQLLARREILDLFQRSESILQDLSRVAHALILNSDGGSRHELVAVLYEGESTDATAFLYPFLVS